MCSLFAARPRFVSAMRKSRLSPLDLDLAAFDTSNNCIVADLAKTGPASTPKKQAGGHELGRSFRLRSANRLNKNSIPISASGRQHLEHSRALHLKQ
jgi:hypothetical protein